MITPLGLVTKKCLQQDLFEASTKRLAVLVSLHILSLHSCLTHCEIYFHPSLCILQNHNNPAENKEITTSVVIFLSKRGQI